VLGIDPRPSAHSTNSILDVTVTVEVACLYCSHQHPASVTIQGTVSLSLALFHGLTGPIGLLVGWIERYLRSTIGWLVGCLKSAMARRQSVPPYNRAFRRVLPLPVLYYCIHLARQKADNGARVTPGRVDPAKNVDLTYTGVVDSTPLLNLRYYRCDSNFPLAPRAMLVHAP
jgi:hypothetical protein